MTYSSVAVADDSPTAPLAPVTDATASLPEGLFASSTQAPPATFVWRLHDPSISEDQVIVHFQPPKQLALSFELTPARQSIVQSTASVLEPMPEVLPAMSAGSDTRLPSFLTTMAMSQ